MRQTDGADALGLDDVAVLAEYLAYRGYGLYAWAMVS
jgi:hypothetical protein